MVGMKLTSDFRVYIVNEKPLHIEFFFIIITSISS